MKSPGGWYILQTVESVAANPELRKTGLAIVEDLKNRRPERIKDLETIVALQEENAALRGLLTQNAIDLPESIAGKAADEPGKEKTQALKK